MEYRQAEVRAAILKALAHPARILIVDALSRSDRCVMELSENLPIVQSNVSRHLAVLKRAGIVRDYRRGARVFYRLETPCILRAFDCAVEVVKQDRKRRLAEMKGALR